MQKLVLKSVLLLKNFVKITLLFSLQMNFFEQKKFQQILDIKAVSQDGGQGKTHV